VATATGTFRPAGLAEGDAVRPGQVLGHVRGRQGDSEVTAHAAGVLVEWLADADDPVAQGAPLVRFADLGIDEPGGTR
jgi:pyruvate/2-oxoglutarate dehydrogenase complex dihydrolipoamide acyltransferase (E2) component